MVELPQKEEKTEMKKQKCFRDLCAPLRPFASFIPLLAMMLFFGALLWAKEQDPFTRKWFTVTTTDQGSCKCVAVLPKPMRRYPVVIYIHGARGSLMGDGSGLREMAELGLAVVGLDYDQTRAAIFDAQFKALLRYVGRQEWADTNAMAWVGSSLGADRTLGFVREHPEQPPRLLVFWSGPGLPERQTGSPWVAWHCPTLLVHGNHDETFPVDDTKRLAAFLNSNNAPAELEIVPNVLHHWEPDRDVVFRSIGEYCLTHLAGKDAWQKYHSIAQWQAEAPALWLFWVPAMGWAVGWPLWSWHGKTRSSEKTKLTRGELALRWMAVLLATSALGETAVHLVPTHFLVGDTTLSLARRILVQAKQTNDFEYLAAQPIWRDEKLKTLLDHVDLAGYNRELINWQLDDQMYRDYVLSPVISGHSGEKLSWRRVLWEEFYPRIRHETRTEDAARMVARHLRERVTIATAPQLTEDVPDMWRRQITDKTGFDIIYVAALRSVGIPARLDGGRRPEFWDGKDWQAAPRPLVENWEDSKG
jgi:dienelactone hydrolase